MTGDDRVLGLRDHDSRQTGCGREYCVCVGVSRVWRDARLVDEWAWGIGFARCCERTFLRPERRG